MGTSNLIRASYMLIDQQDCDVFALLGETVEGALDRRGLGLVIHYEIVLLGVWRLGNVLHGSATWHKVGIRDWRPTPTPASRMPVTES